ncbi:hypothetical protein [Mycobacteroides abscessus]|uniref:Putative lipoprotein n=1 Tax=Mycobacteroides abscessus MAB_091912_2446 TaxID=1335414 RepID=A0A829MCW1_9MYCO|nr:hypothetical protein [Mycobacteroides abscessus]ESV58884.1 putative lipoprotein [Mycobacteroides abscessus MAB_082312_2258]ESV62266.1 putative lipoprotein [Mycobacteroides abscessus MAB_091912_2446]QSM04427.1 hypothetical protein PROPHIGD02-2_19 [Mycobacterium phage prophiGD02-2]QST87289.1 hypothetical protein PROPHIGD90-1_19 [Mycobacterium phage prophiGD90-1]AWG55588.1 hypothetical protein DDT53_16075 [Mycobacteroides abscessus]
MTTVLAVIEVLLLLASCAFLVLTYRSHGQIKADFKEMEVNCQRIAEAHKKLDEQIRGLFQ